VHPATTASPEDNDLDRFCASEYPRLVGTLTLYCGSRDIAEVLAQDVLVKVCDRWEQVRHMAAPGAWAHRVAINAANSWFTRRSAERRAMERAGHPSEEAVEQDVAAMMAIRAAVAMLPPRRRAAVVLRYFADLSVEDTAAVMRCGPATVRALTYQAINQLRASGEWTTDEEVLDGG
jgi:RNA polymerase sigma-70 factor (ECF subfamily)